MNDLFLQPHHSLRGMLEHNTAITVLTFIQLSTVTHSFYFFQFQGMRRNFISYRYGPINTLDEPYDFLSIMHYDNKAFTKNGKDTLQSLTNPKMKLGQTKRLTKTDVNQINKLYRCGTRVRKGINILYTVQGE